LQVVVWQHNRIMASGKGLVAALAAPAGKAQPLRKV
jgi:hypothetical protein